RFLRDAADTQIGHRFGSRGGRPAVEETAAVMPMIVSPGFAGFHPHMPHEVAIAPGVVAIVRDWLDANHVLIGSGDSVLVDTGCSAHADATIALVRAAARGDAPRRIVNTHCHSDHMGGNAALARAFGAA